MSNENKKTALPKLRFPEFQDAAEWAEKSFDQLFTIGGGRDYKHLEEGDIPMYGSGGYMHSVNDYLYEGESVCIGRKGTIDKPMFLSGKFWTVDTLFYTHSFQGCLPKFIYLLFQNVEWLKHNEAGGIPSLSKTIINALKAHVPALPEQQKIADCFSHLDDLLTAQSAKLEALKAHKRGLMQGLFPAEGETVPKLRFPEFQDAAEWADGSLGKYLLRHPEYGVNAAAVPFSDGLPAYLRITDISEEGHYLRRNKVSVAAEVTESNYLQGGDIVLARTGASVGKSYKYRLKDGKLVFAGFLIRVRPDEKKLNSEFLSQFLSTEQYWRWVAFSSTRSGQPGINGNEYASMPLPVPPSLEEQQKIADCLSSLDNRITAQSQKIEALKLHKKGLMQHLFPAAAEPTA